MANADDARRYKAMSAHFGVARGLGNRQSNSTKVLPIAVLCMVVRVGTHIEQPDLTDARTHRRLDWHVAWLSSSIGTQPRNPGCSMPPTASPRREYLLRGEMSAYALSGHGNVG